MNNEQNIDDILKLLKESVDNSTDGGDIPDTTKQKKMSEEELQRELTRRYSDEEIFGRPSGVKGPYDLDNSMLEEFTSEGEEVILPVADVSHAPVALLDDKAPWEEDVAEDITDEDIVGVIAQEEIPSEDGVNNSAEMYIEAEPSTDGDIEPDTFDDVDELEGIELTEENNDDLKSIFVGEDENDGEKEVDVYGEGPKLKPLSMKALMMDYGHLDAPPERAEMPKPIEHEDTETPDLSDIISDFTDNLPTRREHVNNAVHELMSKLGCEDELSEISGEDMGALIADYEGTDEPYDEKGSASRKKMRQDAYKKNIIISLIRTGICALLALVSVIYDLLPVFDVDLHGPLDYISYPFAYVAIGFQLLVLCAVCLWQPLWDGIKKLISPYPNIYSMAALLVASNFVYDLVIIISDAYDPIYVPVFHFLSCIVILLICILELIGIWREAGAYDLYSADMTKYTLSVDHGKNSIAAKMYHGGFSKEKTIYIPTPVSRAKGFTKAIREGGSFENGFYSSLLFISPIASVLFMITLLIMGKELHESAVFSMSLLIAIMPICVVGVHLAQILLIGIKLTKKGIALTGKEKIKKYSKADTLCYNDLNLFYKCDSKDVGFVCYEKAQTNSVLAALEILYSRIGGPMSDVFAKVPDNIRAKRIRVRRITKNGIEALIDRSHVILVGDLEFMRRYGIAFPQERSSANGKNAIIYISYEGRASAKISAKYVIDAEFDIFAERFAKNGGHCVIETYDPMINTAFIAMLRKKGRAPISVVHKNASDINRRIEDRETEKRRSDNGILCVSSRMGLIEAVVWCKRLVRAERISQIIVISGMGIISVLMLILALLNITTFAIPFIILVYAMVITVAVFIITWLMLPEKNYFTKDALDRDEHEKGN